MEMNFRVEDSSQSELIVTNPPIVSLEGVTVKTTEDEDDKPITLEEE